MKLCRYSIRLPFIKIILPRDFLRTGMTEMTYWRSLTISDLAEVETPNPPATPANASPCPLTKQIAIRALVPACLHIFTICKFVDNQSISPTQFNYFVTRLLTPAITPSAVFVSRWPIKIPKGLPANPESGLKAGSFLGLNHKIFIIWAEHFVRP